MYFITTDFFRLRNFFCFLLLPFFVSCATILGGGKKNTTLEINSNPAGAEVFDNSGNFLGKTPVTVTLPKAGSYQVTLRKKGYQSFNYTFQAGNKNGFLLLDALLLCIPCAVDIPNHSLEQIIDPVLNSNLRKEPGPVSDTLFFTLGEPEFALQKEEYIGTYRKEKMYFKLNDYVIGSRKLIQNIICNASQSCYIKFRNCSQSQGNLFDYVGAPHFALKPVVKKLEADIFLAKGKDYGRGRMITEWQVLDTRGGKGLIKVFETDCQVSIPIKITRNLVDSLFLESYFALLNIDSLYDVLSQLGKNNKQAVSSGKMTLKKPEIPVFEKTKDLVKYTSQAVVTVSHEDGFGSGFIISNDGFIITNYHVVKERKQVNIKLNAGITLNADVVQIDRIADLALLKINGKDFVPLMLGNSDSVELGEDVLAIGTPTSMQLGQTITKGIVSGKRKVNDIIYIQTDVSINEGNSGGPLLNEKGEVVGIITMKIIGEGIEGLGFCIPVNKVFESFGFNY